MWEEVFCRFVVLFRSKNAKDGLFRNESTGCFHGETVAADTIHVLPLCSEKMEEIKRREGKVTLSAREKLKGMKYSAIKICREFFIHRIKHLYVPWKESEMKRETEREDERKRDDKWKVVEEGMDSECYSEQVPQEHIKWTVL